MTMKKRVRTVLRAFLAPLWVVALLLAVLCPVFLFVGGVLAVSGFGPLLLQGVAEGARRVLGVAGGVLLLVYLGGRFLDKEWMWSIFIRGPLFLVGGVLTVSGFGSLLLQEVSPAGKAGLGLAGVILFLVGIGGFV